MVFFENPVAVLEVGLKYNHEKDGEPILSGFECF